MIAPVLPGYQSSENTVFHPAFHFALRNALDNKGYDWLTIKSQFQSPTGPIDLVVFDTRTQKVVFPIEIKRTQSSVRGQGRRQARDYWVNLGVQCQTAFYCVSNLELIELFRDDPARPRTSAQRVTLALGKVGVLEQSTDPVFYDALTQGLEEVLSIVLAEVPYQYANGLTQLQASAESVINDAVRWHQTFMPACFEYIRGSATNIPNLHAHTSSWRSADFYQGNPGRLTQYGRRIDFEHIFCEPTPESNDPAAFLNAILLEAYESGKAHAGGDDIAELVNEILAPRYPGVVETDAELAQLMAIVARAALGRELHDDEIVMDPGAGSGRLLTALTLLHAAFPKLKPTQVWANEKEPNFAQSLSLRLGLAFAQTLSPDNAPQISIGPIECVEPERFDSVGLVLMNPPFISGVMGAEIKRGFASRIHDLSGEASKLDAGQVALEILFLELVWHLVKPGTVIATVFPTQHLYRLSAEVVNFRRFLLEEFGLTHVVAYPSRGIFQDVTKQTLVLVGKKGASPNSVQLVEVHQQLGNVDFISLYSQLLASDAAAARGVQISALARNDLLNLVDKGWKQAIGAGRRAQAFISTYFSGYMGLSGLASGKVRRGTVGNGGNTRLTVFDKTAHRYAQLESLIPSGWRCPVLNTTDGMPRILTIANAPQATLVPETSAYVPGTAEHQLLLSIINAYQEVERPRSGAQPRREHSVDAVVRKLRADQRSFGPGWVLIQRASRTRGEIGLLEEAGVFLSTNVPMVQLPTPTERKLLASWLLSIFGQLQLELYSTPQEGMRKLEMSGVKKVQYPDFSRLSQTVIEQLCANMVNEPALDFSKIEARPSDHIWAKVLDAKAPQACLESALDIMLELVDERTGFGNAA